MIHKENLPAWKLVLVEETNFQPRIGNHKLYFKYICVPNPDYLCRLKILKLQNMFLIKKSAKWMSIWLAIFGMEAMIQRKNR